MKNSLPHSITDNFLERKEFDVIRDFISSDTFPWYYNSVMVQPPLTENELSPGVFNHLVYNGFESLNHNLHSLLAPALKQLRVAILTRIKLNLVHKLSKPYFGTFHLDTPYLKENIASEWKVSILYLNTNNGYTELKNGTRIESVENRLVSFPSNIAHRVVTQTDTKRRMVINFNYLELKKGDPPLVLS